MLWNTIALLSLQTKDIDVFQFNQIPDPFSGSPEAIQRTHPSVSVHLEQHWVLVRFQSGIRELEGLAPTWSQELVKQSPAGPEGSRAS